MQPEIIDKSILKKLRLPPKNSKKGDNGVLMNFAGGTQHHAPLMLSTLIASKFTDGVLINSTEQNIELINKLKSRINDFIPVGLEELSKHKNEVDAVLIGPGMGKTKNTSDILETCFQMFLGKKIVVDADALKLIDKKYLNENVIITPSKKEFQLVFNKEPNLKNAQHMAMQYGCIIILKGESDFICTRDSIFENQTGNAGLTKAFTGDILAGLIAALATKNDLVTAACAGTFLVGLAADHLFKEQSYFYNATDLANQIPKTFNYLRKELK